MVPSFRAELRRTFGLRELKLHPHRSLSLGLMEAPVFYSAGYNLALGFMADADLVTLNDGTLTRLSVDSKHKRGLDLLSAFTKKAQVFLGLPLLFHCT